MGPKFGIIPWLLFSAICFSLIGDFTLEAKPNRPKRALGISNPIKKAKKIYSVVNNVISLVTGIDGLVDMFDQDNSEEEFRNNVTTKLDDLEKKITNLDNGIFDLKKIVGETAAQTILENALEEDKNYMLEIKRKLHIIESRYNQDFSNIRRGIKNYTDETMDRYVSSIIYTDDLKDKLRDILFATKLRGPLDHYFHKNVFEIAISYSNNEKYHHRDCNKIPAYDELFLFYDYIVRTVIKGYTMIVMAYQYRKMKSPNNAFYKEGQTEYQNYHKDAVIKITDAAKYYLNSINSISYKSSFACDPQKWEEGKNYIQVKNYVAMTGNYYCVAEGYPIWRNKDLVVTRMCNDVFLETKHFLDNKIVPQFTEYQYRFSERHMCPPCEYREQENYLYRQCETDKNSDRVANVRKLSLFAESCDIAIDEVVTSLRFYESEGMIYIEPQCGIFADGRVDRSSLQWRTDTRKLYNATFLPNHVVLDWKTRTFNLEDIVLPEGDFVVGVQLEVKENVISLKLSGKTMYDLNNTKSSASNSEVNAHKNSQTSRQDIPLTKLPVAKNQKSQTYEMSEPGSSLVHLSVSNPNSSTRHDLPVVPFFDMSEYKPTLPLPLGGIGLMYKSVPNHAGFLAFKFISSSYTHYISDDYAEKLAPKPVK